MTIELQPVKIDPFSFFLRPQLTSLNSNASKNMKLSPMEKTIREQTINEFTKKQNKNNGY